MDRMLGRLLLRARRGRGLTRRDLADRLKTVRSKGATEALVKAIESGNSPVQGWMAPVLVDALREEHLRLEPLLVWMAGSAAYREAHGTPAAASALRWLRERSESSRKVVEWLETRTSTGGGDNAWGHGVALLAAFLTAMPERSPRAMTDDLAARLVRYASPVHADVIEGLLADLTTVTQAIDRRDVATWEARHTARIRDVVSVVQTLREFPKVTGEYECLYVSSPVFRRFRVISLSRTEAGRRRDAEDYRSFADTLARARGVRVALSIGSGWDSVSASENVRDSGMRTVPFELRFVREDEIERVSELLRRGAADLLRSQSSYRNFWLYRVKSQLDENASLPFAFTDTFEEATTPWDARLCDWEEIGQWLALVRSHWSDA